MPEFFVCIRSIVQMIDAASEQDAAEAILEQPVTTIPALGDLPVCCVKFADGLDAPGIDGLASGFWVSSSGDLT